jgi:hypothetical protein
MYNDGYDILYTLTEKSIENKDVQKGEHWYIKPGENIKVLFTGNEIGYNPKISQKYKVRLIGEVDINPLLRTEGGFPPLYRDIDDSLSSNITHHSRYSLNFCSNGEDYPLKICYKVVWSDIMGELPEIKYCSDNKLKLGLWWKKENIKIMPGGVLKLVAEVFYRKADRHIRDISSTPDEVYSIDMGEGTSEWQQKYVTIEKKGDIASILVYAVGERFKGQVWVEDVYLLFGDFPNLLPQFSPSTPHMKEFNWLGINLSKKEWPEFDITLNGQNIFKGELFQRIYRWPASEIEIPLDVLLQDSNEMVIGLTSDYREALPYKLRKVEFTGKKGGFRIVACPSVVSADKEFSVLVSVDTPGVKAVVKSSVPGIKPVKEEVEFERAGLNTVKLYALNGDGEAKITFKTEEGNFECNIERIVEREEDRVLTGTSDAVYISNNAKEMEQFLSWYMHHQIGNFITFRPVYRWSGSRTAPEGLWKDIACICSDMGMYYANMLEARELPGSNANPEKYVMESNYYLGDQTHERDGFYCYWGAWQVGPNEEFFSDMLDRSAKHSEKSLFKPPARTENGVFHNYDPYKVEDMEQAAQNFVNNVSYINDISKRHTGPSVLFKYFYMAGAQWLGAELMYGPHEVIISALRGASKAYRKDSFGGHLAVQWSTTPHDTEERYRRYSLALYLCYMHGVDQINTEEGLWRLEERYADFERFSKPCIKHREVQQNFFKFIQTHSRRGKMHVPMAFIHGQHDGWRCFGRGNAWNIKGEEWRANTSEESWDLLKVFYPRSVLNAIYRHQCPNEPQGYYTGTPYGTVDIVPIEADNQILQDYRILSFLGWNTAEDWQVEKLIGFVENGGTLLLGLPHILKCKKRSDAYGENPELLNSSKINRLLGAKILGYKNSITKDEESIKIGTMELAGAKVLVESLEGQPIVLENSLGKGKVLFVNIKEYPAHRLVRKLYESLLENLGKTVLMMERDKGWLSCSSDVNFTVYDRKTPSCLRVIYFMNINWWESEGSPKDAELLWGDNKIKLKVARENINIMTLSQNWGVWTHDNETDVISIEEGRDEFTLRLQGKGDTNIHFVSKLCSNKEYDLVCEKCKDFEVDIAKDEAENMWNIKLNLDGTKTLVFKNQRREVIWDT